MRITAIIISFFCVFGGISAQNYTISGKIVDSKTSEAIEMAGVRLMRSDSSYVDGMSTIADGSFRFKVKNLGKYILKYITRIMFRRAKHGREKITSFPMYSLWLCL